MGLTIYGIGASRASRPFWAALELGVPFEHIVQSYKDGGTRTPEFLAINPNGHIPAMVDERPEGKVTVWESMACALYIARVHGRADGQSITPSSAREEAEALRWSFWTVTGPSGRSSTSTGMWPLGLIARNPGVRVPPFL